MRYLKPVQVYGRLWRHLYHPAPTVGKPPALRATTGIFQAPARRGPCMHSPNTFEFLHETHAVSASCDWDNPSWEKLWRYNLHYFDDLVATGARARDVWHRVLIFRWINENPPGQGTGWEPYPISLRIVNWIKWWYDRPTSASQSRDEFDSVLFIGSLATQSRFLYRRLEFHLLGNHLLANAKALIFAGLFFQGDEADHWLAKGINVFEDQLREQILPDGGHVERSPMYHAIVLEDLLDLVNITQLYPSLSNKIQGLAKNWRETVQRMRRWTLAMLHPDGDMALLNDSALGIAAHPSEIDAYARRLGLGNLSVCEPGLTNFKESGYVRWDQGPIVAFLDVGDIGPDYLPGHAHADTLSFELSVFGHRVIVDSGTSCYGSSPERIRQRGTAAHNTVTIDDKDSSEVWGGFRVARRARPVGLEIRFFPGRFLVSCAHDGFRRLRGKPTHRRLWGFDSNGLLVRDLVDSRWQDAVARFHFHPSLKLQGNADSAMLITPSGKIVCFQVLAGEPKIVDSSYHPQFGTSIPSRCLEVRFTAPESAVRFFWR